MAAQQQVAGRRARDAAMKTNNSNIQVFEGKPVSNNYSDPGHFQAASPTGSEDGFHDSGLFLDYDQPIRSGNNYEDFVLLDDGPPFIDEEDASMIANHGSTYNGSNNERAAQIQKYTSFNYDDERPVTSFREAVAGAIEAGVNETADNHRPPQQDGPSLFANFQATSGPSMLSQWATTDHRHEIIAYRFEQPPYPADRLQTPPPPPAKRRRTESGKERRRR